MHLKFYTILDPTEGTERTTLGLRPDEPWSPVCPLVPISRADAARLWRTLKEYAETGKAPASPQSDR